MRKIAKPAGLIADFPLDDEWPTVAVPFERIHKLRDIHFTLPQRNFRAPLARNFGAPGVLDVDRPDIRAEYLDSSNRVAHVIKQHVGRIKVDLEIWQTQLVERKTEKVCSLLTRLERQRDPLGSGQPACLTQSFQNRSPTALAGGRS